VGEELRGISHAAKSLVQQRNAKGFAKGTFNLALRLVGGVIKSIASPIEALFFNAKNTLVYMF